MGVLLLYPHYWTITEYIWIPYSITVPLGEKSFRSRQGCRQMGCTWCSVLCRGKGASHRSHRSSIPIDPRDSSYLGNIEHIYPYLPNILGIAIAHIYIYNNPIGLGESLWTNQYNGMAEGFWTLLIWHAHQDPVYSLNKKHWPVMAACTLFLPQTYK